MTAALDPAAAHAWLDEHNVTGIRLRRLASSGELVPACAMTCACSENHCIWPGGPEDWAPIKWRDGKLAARNVPSDDHTIPRMHGGNDSVGNCRVAHTHCQNHQGTCLQNADPELVAARAEQLARLHTDPEWRRILAEHNASPEQKAHLSRLHADPRWQARNREQLIRVNADPGHRTRHQDRLALLNADPEQQARNKAQLAKLNAPGQGRINNCLGKRIRKGKPCYCGQHTPDAHEALIA